MTTVQMRPGSYALLLLVLAAGLVLLEFGGLAENRGALLVTLVFWSGLLQGMVAAVAVAELTDARWVASLRRELLSAQPLLLFLALLFFLLWPLLDLYPWAGAPGAWLNRPFFFVRNLLLLFGTCLAGLAFAARSLRQEAAGKPFAVLYLFLFVACQTLVAYDWVMSLAYPWVSTLLGPYFFVEALFAGLALAGVLLCLQWRAKTAARPDASASHLRDIGTLLFGFCILWGGLFFAQYLLLWYGNLPEETQLIAERLSSAFYRDLALFFLAACFLFPFLVFLSRRAKRTPGIVLTVSAVILLGLLAEKLFFIGPEVELDLAILLAQNGLMLALWLVTVHSRDLLLPAEKSAEEKA